VFGSYGQAEEFKPVSVIIDTNRTENPTLIIHVDGEGAASLADRIKELCTTYTVQVERERRSATDIRVIATID